MSGEEEIVLTNRTWRIRRSALTERFSFTTLRIINDFEAIAWAISRLDSTDVQPLGRKLEAAKGVRIALDDFGTGYSSLSYLRRFPVDTLKIDQSFVKTMDAENYAIITTIVGLARNLDLKVVAEGVETTHQQQLLALAGCRSAQGYLFSEPMPAENVAGFIESNRPISRRTKLKSMARSTAEL